MSNLTVISANGLGVICVEGDDAQSFLQGQATPDLRRLANGDSVFGAFCNAQGRVIANGWFQRTDAGFRIVLSQDLLVPLIKRLRMYVLRAKVLISDQSDHSPLWLMNGSPGELTFLWKIEGPVGIRLIAARLDELPSDAIQLHGESFQLALIQAGIPLVCAKTSERFIPHMLSMDSLGGLSFDKGCYTGQEIVTRTQFLGKVKRSLHRIAADANVLLEAGTPIHSESGVESVGELFTWARLPSGGIVGLAVIRNEAASESALEVEGQRIEVIPVAEDSAALV